MNTTIDHLPPETAQRFRNIHFLPADAPQSAGQTPGLEPARREPVESVETATVPVQPFTAGRLRWVQRSPAEEFAARAGEHAPLAPEVTALILFRKEKLTCGRDGLAVKIKTEGEGREVTRKYWHENSLCCSPGWLGREVYAAYNRHAPHCLYVFTADGEFIEAVPEKGQDEWFGAGESLAAHRRHQAHALKRLEHLHAPDAARAVEAAAGNTTQLLKVVQTFPQPAGPNHTDPRIDQNLRPGSRPEPTRRSAADSLARDCFAPPPARESAPPDRSGPVMDHTGRIDRGVPAQIAAHEERLTETREQQKTRAAALQSADDLDPSQLI